MGHSSEMLRNAMDVVGALGAAQTCNESTGHSDRLKSLSLSNAPAQIEN